MPDSINDRSHKLMRALVATGVSLLVMIAVAVAFRAYSHRAVERRWMNDVNRLGARAISAGYEDTSSGVGRVPILGEILTHRQQVELFLDNPVTADAVLDKAAELPQLGRIWVDLTVFDRSMADRIHQELPWVQVQFYTP